MDETEPGEISAAHIGVGKIEQGKITPRPTRASSGRAYFKKSKAGVDPGLWKARRAEDDEEDRLEWKLPYDYLARELGMCGVKDLSAPDLRVCTRDPDHRGPHRDGRGGVWD